MKSFNCAIVTEGMPRSAHERRRMVAAKLREIALMLEQGAVQATLKGDSGTIGMFTFEPTETPNQKVKLS